MNKGVIMRILASIIFALLVLVNNSHPQKKNNDKSDLIFDAMNFFPPEGTRSRLDIYLEIPYNTVEFRKTKSSGSNFVASFDVTVNIKDKNGSTVYNNVSKEEILTQKTGIEYLSSNSQIITKNIILNPGDYKIKLSFYEPSSKKYLESEKNVVVRDFQSPQFSISDVMIVSKIGEQKGIKYLTPCVSRNTGMLDSFYVFFFVYRNNPEADYISVKCRIIDNTNTEIFSKSHMFDVISGIAPQNQMLFVVSTKEFSYGDYTIEISAVSANDTTVLISKFENENPIFPFSLERIDDLIDQLQYIALDNELAFMREGKTISEKQKRFLEFWKKIDPSPLTKKNEIMNEYYLRIANANKNYSTRYTPGWRTDMGMVYIIFGSPNNIERHPYEMDSKPYEVWEYYTLDQRFIFVDNTGFGDYRLITPIWERFRMRN